MVYSPQRRHASASLTMTIQALSVLQQLYTPNILIIFSRLLVQTQISMAPFVHPTRSLLALFALILLVNTSAVCLHLLDFYAGLNGGKGVVLDFVGQSYPASMGRLLWLDLGLFILQTVSLVVSFITNHAGNIPSSAVFPYEDLLLPPTEMDSGIDDDEEPLDLESRTLTRRRGKRKGDDEENAVWLSEDYPEPSTSTTSSSRLLSSNPGSIRRRDPPLIFSLSLPHLLNLIARLPSPSPPRSFSGGTPAGTPSHTPAAELPPPTAIPSAIITPTTADTMTTDTTGTTGLSSNDADDGEDTDDTDTGGGSLSGRNRFTGDARRGSGIGRIPGDYWVERRSGS